jgi:hypothetical protein
VPHSKHTTYDLLSSGILRSLSGKPLPTFRDNIGPIFKDQEVQKEKKDGTDTLSRNVGKRLPLVAA